MKLITTLAIGTSKVLLVPYCAHHVPTYHTWIQDPDLQSATASEPLILDEEYSMQRRWRADHDKLTFITCLPLLDSQQNSEVIRAGEYDSADQMIGDVNLFLFQDEDTDNKTSVVENSNSSTILIGEIELMIARKDLHHQGYGQNTLITFMHYVLLNWERIAREYYDSKEYCSRRQGVSSLPSLAYLRAKIHQTNERSIRLFESVGFEKVGEGANYFGEVELRWRGGVDEIAKLKWFEEPRELRYVEDGRLMQ